jgi:tripartite-type tricarboxylate transporter receptor subunit TctC
MSGNRQDISRDVAPVALFGYGVNAFAVPAGSPVSSVKDYVAMAQRQPGSLMYGSGGVGSSQFLGFELLKRASGIQVDPVHYKGAPPILVDLASGRLSASFVPSAVARSQAQGGRIKILAVANKERLAGLPDTPTMAEAGFPDASVSPWFAVMVPAGTPAAIVSRIENEIGAAVATPDLKARFDSLGGVPVFLGAADTAAMIRKEIRTWQALARSIGFKAD